MIISWRVSCFKLFFKKTTLIGKQKMKCKRLKVETKKTIRKCLQKFRQEKNVGLYSKGRGGGRGNVLLGMYFGIHSEELLIKWNQELRKREKSRIGGCFAEEYQNDLILNELSLQLFLFIQVGNSGGIQILKLEFKVLVRIEAMCIN